jgi:hypothetical protein
MHCIHARTHARTQAAADPAQASHLLITIQRCEGLVLHGQQQQARQQQHQARQQPAQAPYVHYSAPGRSSSGGSSHDTPVGVGPSPVFDDAASWGLVRSAAADAALQQHTLQVAVFDDAVDDPAAALLGLAGVSCAALALGQAVEGCFPLAHPTTGAAAGAVWLSIAWHDPLATAAAGISRLQPRLPATSAAAAAAVAEAASAGPAASVSAPPPGAAALTHDPVGQQQQQQQQQQGWAQLFGQQQQQQQQQAPTMLPSVPMLLVSPQRPGEQQPTAGHAPSVHAGAAAAVAAAVARTRQQQQHPLLLAAPPPGDPTSPFKRAGECGSGSAVHMLARPAAASPPTEHGRQQQLWGPSAVPPPAGGGGPAPLTDAVLQLVAAASAAACAALASPQQRLGTQGGAAVLPPQQQHPQQQHPQQQQQLATPVPPVLRRVLPNPDAWGAFDTTIYLRLECLSLSEDALADPAVGGRHVLLAHMLLEDFTSPVQQCTDTALASRCVPVLACEARCSGGVRAHVGSGLRCWQGHPPLHWLGTRAVPLHPPPPPPMPAAPRPGQLPFSYAAAYTVADAASGAPTTAGAALARALAAAEAGQAPALVLPVLLATSEAAAIADFATVECVASCELSLSDMWAGASGDVISREVSLYPAAERAGHYHSGCAGQLRLTLVAERALATLRRQQQLC